MCAFVCTLCVSHVRLCYAKCLSDVISLDGVTIISEVYVFPLSGRHLAFGRSCRVALYDRGVTRGVIDSCFTLTVGELFIY